jgi:hypothetical protein
MKRQKIVQNQPEVSAAESILITGTAFFPDGRPVSSGGIPHFANSTVVVPETIASDNELRR